MKKFKHIIFIILIMAVLVGCNESNYSSSPNLNIEVPNDEVMPNDKSNTKNELIDGKNDIDLISIEDYMLINSHKFSVEEGNLNIDFKGFADDLSNTDIVLTGEIHGIKSNYEMKLALIKYIKQKNNFKYLLAELPYSVTYYINNYLETGDISILDNLPVSSRYTMFPSYEDFYQWELLYDFNQSLPEAERILVLGIDLESDMFLAFSLINDILAKKDISNNMENIVSLIDESISLINQSLQNKYKAVENCNIILQDIEKNRDIYKDFLSDDLVVIENVIRNIVKYKESTSKKGDFVEYNNFRDMMIYSNFEIFDNILPEGKYFGQFGFGHVLQDFNFNVSWFASYLNEEKSKYNNRVLSVVYNYVNCETIDRHRETEISLVFDFISDVQDISESKYILYNLDNVSVKRPDITLLDNVSGDTLDSDVSNNFQYIILMRNTK